MMRVFITGLTGTLGTAIALLHHGRGDQVCGCSRNELNVRNWRIKYTTYIFACSSDAVRLADPTTNLSVILADCDRVYHCAAMKHVDLCEDNPEEAYKQNVELTRIVASACRRSKVPLVFISSDKACLPQSVYGATKLLAEKIVLKQGGAVVRFGNLIGSSGSMFESWKRDAKRGHKIKLTNPDMTRYFVPIDEAARFAADKVLGGFVTIPHPMLSVRVGDAAHACAAAEASCTGVELTGLRPGESLCQWLVAPDDRAKLDDGRLVLGIGDVWKRGMNSADGNRWKIADLLKTAELDRE